MVVGWGWGCMAVAVVVVVVVAVLEAGRVRVGWKILKMSGGVQQGKRDGSLDLLVFCLGPAACCRRRRR